MPILSNIIIQITVDDVLKAQGTKPEDVKKRAPRLVKIAEEALTEAKLLFQPFACYRVININKETKQRLFLEDDITLEEPFLLKHLKRSEKIAFGACTISGGIDRRVAEAFKSNASYALALNSAGVAGQRYLSNFVRNFIRNEANTESTRMFNPGIAGWALENGQKLIFSVLEDISDHIRLTTTWQMDPPKSGSFVIGLGNKVNLDGDYCDTCIHKDHCSDTECTRKFYKNS